MFFKIKYALQWLITAKNFMVENSPKLDEMRWPILRNVWTLPDCIFCIKYAHVMNAPLQNQILTQEHHQVGIDAQFLRELYSHYNLTETWKKLWSFVLLIPTWYSGKTRPEHFQYEVLVLPKVWNILTTSIYDNKRTFVMIILNIFI